MAVSITDICNMALSHVGRSTKPIQNLATDPSVEARMCNQWYDQCRRETLEVMDWSFARRRAGDATSSSSSSIPGLAADNDVPPSEWAYRYQLPPDMLTFLVIWNPFMGQAVPNGNFPIGFWNSFLGDVTNAVPYALELSLDGSRMTLLTNQQQTVILYTADVQNTALFSPQFINALSHLIAAKIAYPIAGKMTVAQEEAKQFVASLSTAASNDASQGRPQPPRDGYAVRSRL